MPAAILQVDEQHRPTDEAGTGAGRIPKGKEALVNAVGRFRHAGATWTSVPMRHVKSVDEYLDVLQWTAEEVCAQFRA